ncbi:ring-cleaving dioxygenase [Salinicoccus roseus]|uniref:Ring-cleaving dioxygenase n=2 Tax=Salinicoccus roseus TaxID=45670 RepID=A0A265E599_9STAP|nr:ring-cleaving dioxygenase [Salinicoccus roseus]
MISGHHHISMFTKDLKENNHFYTEVLGLRRVKVSVNQGDVKMYHVFYGDAEGSPGNDLTFFEMPNIGGTHRGTNMISGIGLLVPSHDSLEYWGRRLASYDVDHDGIIEYAGREALRFRDPDGLVLILLNHENKDIPEGWHPWEENDIEDEHHILGMGTVEITVEDRGSLTSLLHTMFGYTIAQEDEEETLLEAVEGEAFGEILIRSGSGSRARAGRGSVHHLAIESHDRPLDEWDRMLKEAGYMTTGVKDRYYFESLYFREENGIMFEIVGPDGRGFTADRDFEELGEGLDLPPFLEDRRHEIEDGLRPIEEWT